VPVEDMEGDHYDIDITEDTDEENGMNQ